MTPNEYQALALRTEKTPEFANRRDADAPTGMSPSIANSRLLHGAIGICTEAGELQDMLKKHIIYGKPIDLVNVLEEAGDLLWYIALSLDASGYTLEDAMVRNIAKLRARYGAKFTEEAALVRDLDAERAALENVPTAGSKEYEAGFKAAQEVILVELRRIRDLANETYESPLRAAAACCGAVTHATYPTKTP